MDILNAVLNAQDGAVVRQLGSQLGLAPEQTQAAISALMPALAGGLQRNMTREGGLESLTAALSSGGHQRYLENPNALTEPATTDDGNGILGHLFGSKDVSREVAQRASAQTGIDAGTLKRMLPLVAAMAMGALSRQSGSGVNAGATAAGASSLVAMLTPLLDQNRDGSMLDDVLGMAGRFLGGRPNPS